MKSNLRDCHFWQHWLNLRQWNLLIPWTFSICHYPLSKPPRKWKQLNWKSRSITQSSNSCCSRVRSRNWPRCWPWWLTCEISWRGWSRRKTTMPSVHFSGTPSSDITITRTLKGSLSRWERVRDHSVRWLGRIDKKGGGNFHAWVLWPQMYWMDIVFFLFIVSALIIFVKNTS